MSLKKVTLIAITTVLTIYMTSSISTEEEATIYTLLSSRKLPTGIFPKGISNFSIDPTTSRFEFSLPTPSSCEALFETPLRYDPTVSGVLGLGSIQDLKGVAAKDLFIWLPVKGVRVDVPASGLIYFDVGVLFKQFSMAYFESPRDCVVVSEDVDLLDLSFVRPSKNQPGKDINENYSALERRAVS